MWLQLKLLSFLCGHKLQVGCLLAVAVRATAPGGWGVPPGEGGDVSGGGQARPGQQNNCIRPDPPVPQCRHCWSQAAVGQHQHGEGRACGVVCRHHNVVYFVTDGVGNTLNMGQQTGFRLQLCKGQGGGGGSVCRFRDFSRFIRAWCHAEQLGILTWVLQYPSINPIEVANIKICAYFINLALGEPPTSNCEMFSHTEFPQCTLLWTPSPPQPVKFLGTVAPARSTIAGHMTHTFNAITLMKIGLRV